MESHHTVSYCTAYHTTPYRTPYGITLYRIILYACLLGPRLLHSVRSPKTTNVVKEPFFLGQLHNDGVGQPGQTNMCSKLFGTKLGIALDAWACKYLVWFLLPCAVCVVMACCHINGAACSTVLPLLPTYIAYALSGLVPAGLLALCLRGSVLKQLARTASVWCYIVSIVAGEISYRFIYGPLFWKKLSGEVDTGRQAAYSFKEAVQTFGLLVCLPALDAVPPRLVPQRARVCWFSFISVYKSAAACLLIVRPMLYPCMHPCHGQCDLKTGALARKHLLVCLKQVQHCEDLSRGPRSKAGADVCADISDGHSVPLQYCPRIMFSRACAPTRTH